MQTDGSGQGASRPTRWVWVGRLVLAAGFTLAFLAGLGIWPKPHPETKPPPPAARGATQVSAEVAESVASRSEDAQAAADQDRAGRNGRRPLPEGPVKRQ